MKQLLTFFSFIISFTCIDAQEKRTMLSGKTVLDSISVVDVHIINKSTKIGTITNDEGLFQIPVKVGDTLFYSHLKYQDKIIFITDKIISDNNFTIHLDEKTVVLKEIVYEKPRSIFYQDPEILTYSGPKVSAKSLKLPFANTKAKENKSIFKIRSGSVVSLDNLIGSINGSKKREKQLKKMSSEDATLLKIRRKFTDDFFITDLKIKKEYINQFLNDCIDKNIIRIFKQDNIIQLTNLLIKESQLYPNKTTIEKFILTKK